jgi:glutamate N-acetyltransferase/amino-acid N-acetyltransferase
MRYKGRLDMALIAADGDAAVSAGVFTRNRFCAAPVQLCRERLKNPREIKGVLINAGNANACSGDEGLRRARAACQIMAAALRVPEESILAASTGVIGPQLVLESFEKAAPELAAGLSPDNWAKAARAIMTTDTVPKMANWKGDIGGRTVTIGGIAKGSGMIAPDMATLLAFICTDAAIEPEPLQYWLGKGADRSFNAITVDGDTSTNDTLIALASGCAGNPRIEDPMGPDGARFGIGLLAVLTDLAKQLVYDGEGATKFIEISVTGAVDDASAKRIALTIANSPLVKTAFFGQDANWGRIVAAAGRAGVPLEPGRVTLYFDDVCVMQDGAPVSSPDVEEKASQVFKQKEIVVRLRLGMGNGSFTAYTCDFSHDYVNINADYRS